MSETVYELENGEFFEGDRIPARCPRCSFQWCVMCWECDCDLTEGHRWDCGLTPIWAETVRGMGCCCDSDNTLPRRHSQLFNREDQP